MVDKTKVTFELSVADAEKLINKLGELKGRECFNEMLFLTDKATQALSEAEKEDKQQAYKDALQKINK